MVEHAYKVIEIIGVSETSWEDAARQAIETAGEHLKDLRIGEVTGQDLKIEDGKVVGFRTRLSVSFKFHGELRH